MLIRIADLNVEMKTSLERYPQFCAGYRLNGTESPDISVSVLPSDLEREQTAVSAALSAPECESNCLYRKIAREIAFFDGFLLHAAVIEKDGAGYAFSAASGTGKSTHVSYWKKHFGDSVRIINGDKPLIRCSDGVFYAYGTPWCGKENWNVNDRVPLTSLAFLERGQNAVCPLSAAEAVEGLLRHTLLPEDPESMNAFLDVLDRFVRAVPVYRVTCDMSTQAAQIAWEGMRK